MAKPLKHRQSEASGFAGARLGGSHHIVAGQNSRYALALDWRGLGVTLLGYGLKNWFPQPEGGEIRNGLRNRVNNQIPPP